MSNLGKKYYVIYWDFGTWNRLHPHGKDMVDAGLLKEKFDKEKRCDIIHEMWLDCLGEWPEPGFFD